MSGAINFFIVFLLGKTVMVKSQRGGPILRLEPEQPVYIVGETLSMRCVASSDPLTSITGYSFYKDAVSIATNVVSNIFRISPLSITDPGNYFCTYYQKTVGRDLESNTINLKVLERPILRLEPEHPVYIVGETLSMRCVAVSDSPISITGYRFYKDAKSATNNTSNILRISPLSITDAGNYFCTYDHRIFGRNLESNNINLKVLESPPAPTLSVEPQRKVFVVNQPVEIRCLVPGQTSAAEIHLYRNGAIIFESNDAGVLSLANTEKRQPASYTCQYTIILSERKVDSHISNPATLVVIDPPPTPVLRHAYSLQNQSREVEIVCETTNPSYSINGYHLYRNGGEILSAQTDRFVMNYSLEFDGYYFCRSFVDILGETILSPNSAEVFLTLEERDRRLCPTQNSENANGLSREGVKLYGSVLIGKLIVLISILLLFGIYLLVNRLRSKKPETEEQSFHRL